MRTELVKESASTAAGKWKLSAPITELELYGDTRLRYEYRGGRTAPNQPVAPPAPGVAGRDDWLGARPIDVIVFASASAERWLMIGFSAFGWKPAPVIARRTSRLELTATTARFRKTTTESS